VQLTAAAVAAQSCIIESFSSLTSVGDLLATGIFTASHPALLTVVSVRREGRRLMTGG